MVITISIHAHKQLTKPKSVMDPDADDIDADKIDAGEWEGLVNTMMDENHAFNADSEEESNNDQAEEPEEEEPDKEEVEAHKLDRMRLSKFPGQAWRKMQHEGHTVKQVEVRKTQKAWYVGDAPDTKPDDMIRVVCLSDTHGSHKQVALPDGDILVHSGDVTMRGELKAMHSFNAWMGRQSSFTFKLVVPGNHDLSLDPNKARQGDFTNVRCYHSSHKLDVLTRSVCCLTFNVLFLLALQHPTN